MQAQALRHHYHCCCALPSLWTQQYYYILVHVHVLVGRVLPIVVEKTVELSGLWREFQCIFSTQSEIGLFPVGEDSLYTTTWYLYIALPESCDAYLSAIPFCTTTAETMLLLPCRPLPERATHRSASPRNFTISHRARIRLYALCVNSHKWLFSHSPVL